MSDFTAEQIAQRALDLNLLDERQLRSVWSECGTREIPSDEFTSLLLRRELLLTVDGETVRGWLPWQRQ